MWDPNNYVVSHTFTNQLQEPEDLEKIKDKQLTLNKEQSDEWLEAAKYVLDGILPVRQAGGSDAHYLGIWDRLSEFMGVENIYIDLMERPEFIHQIMDRMTNSFLAGIHQANALGLMNTSDNTCHCSVIYNDEQLPDFGAGKGSDTYHSWAMGLAQLFTAVSPAGDTMDYDVIAADIHRTCDAAKEHGIDAIYGCNVLSMRIPRNTAHQRLWAGKKGFLWSKS